MTITGSQEGLRSKLGDAQGIPTNSKKTRKAMLGDDQGVPILHQHNTDSRLRQPNSILRRGPRAPALDPAPLPPPGITEKS